MKLPEDVKIGCLPGGYVVETSTPDEMDEDMDHVVWHCCTTHEEVIRHVIETLKAWDAYGGAGNAAEEALSGRRRK